jgi:PA-IL-like protein
MALRLCAFVLSRRGRAALLGVVALSAAVAVWTAAGAAPARTVIVPATGDPTLGGWTNSGINLAAGQTFRIEASGRASFDPRPEYQLTDPSGAGHDRRTGAAVVPRYDAGVIRTAPIGVLIGAVLANGVASKPFVLGAASVKTAPMSGALLLAYNDNPGQYSNNSGSYTVKIQLTSTYVALGDSYSSGEGVDPYFRDGYDQATGTQPGDVDNRCHRSTRAYAEYVNPPGFNRPLYELASGGGDPGTGKRVNKYGSDQNVRQAGLLAWVFWACSGAKTKHVLPKSLGGRPQSDSRFREHYAQLDNPTVNSSADLVTITIGGNDVGFRDVLTTCATSRRSCNNPAFRAALEAKIDALKPALTKASRLFAKRRPTPESSSSAIPTYSRDRLRSSHASS